jgi:hypothetical protein
MEGILNGMSDLFSEIVKALAFVCKPKTDMCSKCKMLSGEGFCDRLHLGETDACQFVLIDSCKTCNSPVACFGHPCELSDRIASMREGHMDEIERKRHNK